MAVEGMNDDLTSAYLLGAYNASREWRDAAEFEARVAKKLASPWFNRITCSSECPWNRMNPKDTFGCIHEDDSRFCRLREARLEVEEEMDK